MHSHFPALPVVDPLLTSDDKTCSYFVSVCSSLLKQFYLYLLYHGMSLFVTSYVCFYQGLECITVQDVPLCVARKRGSQEAD